MTSSPDRPFQTLSDSDLAARIAASQADRPFASMPDDELDDEITFARIHATSGNDLSQRRKQAKRLAELLGEQGHRASLRDGLPF